MKTDAQLELCLKEIDIVQGNIQRYDQNGLTIKSWCLTTWSLVTAFALQNQNATLVLLSAFMVLAFSFTEFIYRRFQCRFIQRSSEIEALLDGGNLKNYKYSVYRASTNRNTVDEIKYVLSQPQFSVFYVSLMLLSVVLVILVYANVI